jgi:hypothetical protein
MTEKVFTTHGNTITERINSDSTKMSLKSPSFTSNKTLSFHSNTNYKSISKKRNIKKTPTKTNNEKANTLYNYTSNNSSQYMKSFSDCNSNFTDNGKFDVYYK